MIKNLLPSAKEYSKASVLSMLFVALEVMLEVAIPFLMSKIVDVGLAAGATAWSATFLGFLTVSGATAIEFILKMGAFMVGVALVSLFFGALSGRYCAVASTGFAMSVRRRAFNKVQDFSFGNIDKYSTPSLITRLTTDINYLQMAYMMLVRLAVRAPVMMILAASMAFAMDAELALIFLVAVPVLAAVIVALGSLAFPRFMKMLQKYDKLTARLQENLIGIRVVKSFAREDYETKHFNDASMDVRNSELSAVKLMVTAMPFMQAMVYACIIAVCAIGGKRIILGEMQTGEFMSFLAYISQIMMSLIMLSMTLIMIVISRASASRLSEILSEEIEIKDAENPTEERIESGAIEFKNVNFSYGKNPENLTLSNISLTINPGEIVAIIGGTGSGKTTLVQLIPRLYDTLSGEVLVDGRNVRDYKISDLRDAVAMVLQKNVLFSGTIAENLRWGKEDATDEELEAAAKTAEAHGFITSFEKGYDTVLGQGGVNVSGGQRQRLSIARALLKKPKILILDDSTSAIDIDTDRKIREKLKSDAAGITVIIIAQRINSVMSADKIIVMNEGRISAVGKHDELLLTSDIYREVFESQQRGAA
ncbi:MAG: ABC transporter ATP-binding protein [Christensenellales bacterium]|jgi:ATP-binding cassette subfamily B protein|nr:ABC transporter ATP-binding protein [Clostridia bacterium]HRU84247.1 ABC transporter ATP-binding protein [Eubacteriales bacterium]